MRRALCRDDAAHATADNYCGLAVRREHLAQTCRIGVQRDVADWRAVRPQSRQIERFSRMPELLEMLDKRIPNPGARECAMHQDKPRHAISAKGGPLKYHGPACAHKAPTSATLGRDHPTPIGRVRMR